ncbi:MULTISPECIES: D-cysteine desulfhydrase family protein [Microbulbifer]|uniref:D-cysteine desulfhydrase family protein n=1 Tax=Microbulbifer celer TaxID=435905 RepID=A0ABW3UB36_9GAMM|nr:MULTISPECIES: D-cysteine desulfhydrase family protein [Microbulbifer]UFN58762.1 D-cysteine desulfhydrase family protein [Microbulbifer celer]
MSIRYPARVPMANLPTPLEPLDRITAAYSTPHGGPRIWVKRDDLTESAMSGNKLRKLEFIIAEARAQGCNTLITCGGEQSNHCRATALAAAKAGLQAHLILRGGREPRESAVPADGNLLVDYLAGATVSLVPLREYVGHLPALFQHWEQYYAEQGDRALSIPTGGSDGLGIWGYIRAAEELQEDFAHHGISPEYVICASGSGGTQAGLTLGGYLMGAAHLVRAYAVCDNRSYFEEKVARDVLDWNRRQAHPGSQSAVDPHKLSIDVCDEYIGPGYGIADQEVYEVISAAARLEGILLDPVYTGKAFNGMLQDIKNGGYSGCKDIVFVHTGGQFGVFPHRTQFVLDAG